MTVRVLSYLIGALLVALFVSSSWGQQAGKSSSDPLPPGKPSYFDQETGARIYNLKAKTRIDGRYLIVFKSEEKLLVEVPKADKARLKVMPDTMPTSRESMRELAAGLVEAYEAQMKHFLPIIRGFSVIGLSEDAAKEIAHDPRVSYVEAVIG